MKYVFFSWILFSLFAFSWIFSFLVSSCTNKDEDLKVETSTSFDKKEILENVGPNIITPAYNKFVKVAETLNASIGNQDEVDAQKNWKACQDVWQKTQLFEVGNIKSQFLHYPVYRYPIDTHRIEKLYLDTALIDMNNESSLVRGLATLEYLLFYAGKPKSTERWEFIQLVSNDLVNQAKNLTAVWESDKEFYTKLGDNTSGSNNELASSMVSLLEEISSRKLSKPIFQDIPTESPYSEYSLSLIKSNLVSLQTLYLGNEGIGFDDHLIHLQQQALDTKIKSQFINCLQLTNAFNGSLTENIKNNQQQVTEFHEAIKSLLVLIKVDMSSQLGIIVTFNDTDGD